MPEIYVSTDIETDGPIPGPYSMLSIGSAAYSADKELLDTFSANLETLPGAGTHPSNMGFWATQPVAWAACRRDLEAPEAAMRRYLAWLKTLPGTPVFVAWPAGFDFAFVNWYLIRYTDQRPFMHNAIDMKTYAMAALGKDFSATTKDTIPKRWFDDLPHTHIALEDAIEQGALFCNMLKDCLAARQVPP
jgi:hypothetical protein